MAVAERLKVVVDRAGSRRIIDLCSGASGPLVAISRILTEELASPVEVLLTDLYPNVAAFKRIEEGSGGRIKARYEPTSALDVPTELKGVRTIFTAFHHFGPEEARLVLLDAVRKKAAIVVFEPLERTARFAGLLGLMSFLLSFTRTPAVGKLTAARFFFTYLLPIAPAVFAWDGMVSALRSYTPDELHALAMSTEDRNYRWESGRFDVSGPYGPMPTVYLIGVPSLAENRS